MLFADRADGLDLFGVVSPAQHVRERATAAGQRAVAAGRRIAKTAPQLAAKIVSAGNKALQAGKGKGAPKSPAATPAAAAATTTKPTPPSATARPATRSAPTARSLPTVGRPAPTGRSAAPIARPVPGKAPAVQRRTHVGDDLYADDATMDAAEAQQADIYTQLADAATAVADFMAEVQGLQLNLPPGLPLAGQGQAVLEQLANWFGNPLEKALSGDQQAQSKTQDVSDVLQAILANRDHPDRPWPWAWIANANAYLRVHPPAPRVTALTIAPADTTVSPGTFQTFTVSAVDQAGNPMTPTAIKWTSTAGGNIDASGNFTAVRAGIYTVTATADGVAGTTTITVQPGAAAAPSAAPMPTAPTPPISSGGGYSSGGYGGVASDGGYGDAGYGDAGYGDAGYGDAGYGDAGYGDASADPFAQPTYDSDEDWATDEELPIESEDTEVGSGLTLFGRGGGRGGRGGGGRGHHGHGHGRGRRRGGWGGWGIGPGLVYADSIDLDDVIDVDDLADELSDRLAKKKRQATQLVAVGRGDGLALFGAEVTLASLLVTAEQALAEAKQRAGSLAAMFGRFHDADVEIAELKQAPDQQDTRKRCALLIQALEMVPPEEIPMWPILPALGVVGLALAKQVQFAGLLALGGAGLFTAQQLMKTRPSSRTGLALRYDADASKQKAEEDFMRTQKEQDERDTAALIKQAHEDQEKRSVARALAAGALQLSAQPEWAPKPGKPNERRFGYWKEGKFVEVPLQTPVVQNGRQGQYDQAGRFIPFAG